MKKTLQFAAAMAIAFAAAISSSAQSVYVGVASSKMPATLATTVTTNLAQDVWIEVERASTVTFTFSFNQSSASQSNVVYTFYKYADKTATPDTNRPIALAIPSLGTVRQDYMTNTSVQGARFLRLYSIANTTALTTMTNFGINYTAKAGQ